MASKMRDALVAVKELLDGGIMFQNAIRKVHRQVNEALAEPRLNCEVGTASEQAQRFKNFCRTHHFISADSEDGFPPIYVCSNESCPLHDYYIAHGEDHCELAWGQTPFKNEEEHNGNPA